MANTYIISRVDTDQRIRAINWLNDHDFYSKTGIKQTDVYYCFDRKDKAIFVRGLGIDAFIDDRPDVLMCMDNKVDKILFNPYAGDMETYKNDIEINNMLIVRDWNRIGEYFGVIKE